MVFLEMKWCFLKLNDISWNQIVFLEINGVF